MISFSQKIKSELISREMTVYCCAVAELAAYILIYGKMDGDYIVISIENEGIINRICELSKKVLKVNTKPLKLGSVYSVMLSKSGKLMEKFSVFLNIVSESTISDMFKKDCCRSAFIKGIFISCGTIVDPEKTYNLEFFFKSDEIAVAVSDVFSKLDLSLKKTTRKSNYILYTKNSNIICDFLTRIGAYNEQMQILNLKIERELRNDFNRTVNSEIANMDKTIKASIRHITAIEKIRDIKGLECLSDELYELAKLRLEHRDLSISALASKLSTPITKSGVNHRLNKIMEIAEKL